MSSLKMDFLYFQINIFLYSKLVLELADAFITALEGKKKINQVIDYVEEASSFCKEVLSMNYVGGDAIVIEIF
jgi:hypothetical protein